MVNTDKYTIDIIIPVYNSGLTLKKCLDSLKLQTHTNWRALLIDDCSSDNSRDIMREYSETDERFVCVYNEQNMGVSAARNRALDMVSAQYTAFLDSDDYWESEMLRIMLNKACDYKAQIVQCRYMYDYGNGIFYAPAGAFSRERYLEHKDFRPIYIKMMTGIKMNHVCMKLISSDLINDIRFDTDMKTAEDIDFVIRLLKKAENYVFITNVLYHYYRGGSGLTGTGLKKAEKFAANKHIADIIIGSLREWGLDKPIYRGLARSRTYFIVVSKLCRIIRERFAIVVSSRVKL